ncbi:hypothetical protein BDY21DRAFT_341030 [Lineolata rhizophorae]|uniref:Tubby C-terminal-like domain-containing protein n=1 Tax=Lineolata rhizophorae TaxID=578093 RepID=A0A6A6P3V7_9PEZI|nr:hypothetical protein BDY21DRAFT_341030 [Lineolata rhizophorae]
MVEEDKASDLPASSTPFRPTKIFWIVPHNSFSSGVKVLDLTKDIEIPYAVDESDQPTQQYIDAIKDVVQREGKHRPPCYTFVKTNFTGMHVLMRNASDEQVADWQFGLWSTSSTKLQFPPESEHCSHQIIMTPTSIWRQNEAFVVDSCPYQWCVEAIWKGNRFRLDRNYGGQQKEVGRFWQSWSWQTGGALVLDTEEIDEVVGILTMVVMLKKRRHREMERS